MSCSALRLSKVLSLVVAVLNTLFFVTSITAMESHDNNTMRSRFSLSSSSSSSFSSSSSSSSSLSSLQSGSASLDEDDQKTSEASRQHLALQRQQEVVEEESAAQAYEPTEHDKKLHSYFVLRSLESRIPVIPEYDIQQSIDLKKRRAFVSSCLEPFLFRDIHSVILSYEPRPFKVKQLEGYLMPPNREGFLMGPSLRGISNTGEIDIIGYARFPEMRLSHYVLPANIAHSKVRPLSTEITSLCKNITGACIGTNHMALWRENVAYMIHRSSGSVKKLPQDIEEVLGISPSGEEYIARSQGELSLRHINDKASIKFPSEKGISYIEAQFIKNEHSRFILMRRKSGETDIFNAKGEKTHCVERRVYPCALNKWVVTGFNASDGDLVHYSLHEIEEAVCADHVCEPKMFQEVFEDENALLSGALLGKREDRLYAIHADASAPSFLFKLGESEPTHAVRFYFCASPNGRWGAGFIVDRVKNDPHNINWRSVFRYELEPVEDHEIDAAPDSLPLHISTAQSECASSQSERDTKRRAATRAQTVVRKLKDRMCDTCVIQ